MYLRNKFDAINVTITYLIKKSIQCVEFSTGYIIMSSIINGK